MALYLRTAVTQLSQAVAAGAGRFEVGFARSLCAGDAGFELLHVGPGLLECFEAACDAVLGTDLGLAQLAPAIQVRCDLFQLLGGLIRRGGELCGLLRLALGAAADRCRLPPQ